MEKLKPCPFCGGKAIWEHYGRWFVECEKCGATISADSQQGVFDLWNERYEPPTPGGIFVPAGNDRFKKVMSKNIGGKI